MLHRGTRSPYFMEARNSLPANAFVIETDDFVKGRIQGYSSGEAPYVSFCDDDDFLNIAPETIAGLLSGEPAIYSNSTVLYQDLNRTRMLQSPHTWSWQGQLSGGVTVHQLTVVRRDIALEAAMFAEKFLKRNNLNVFLFDLAFNMFVGSRYGWKFIDVNAYTWRHWSPNQGHKGLGAQVDRLRKLFREPIDW